MDEFSKILRQNKLKITPQRLAIFQTLCNTKQHPSAEMIYKSLAPSYPAMSLATVYKTIDALKKANLVQELSVNQDSLRYDANTKSHPHLVCKCCQNVYDVENFESAADTTDSLKEKISQDNDFIIKSEQVYFFGICRDCK